MQSFHIYDGYCALHRCPSMSEHCVVSYSLYLGQLLVSVHPHLLKIGVSLILVVRYLNPWYKDKTSGVFWGREREGVIIQETMSYASVMVNLFEINEY